MLVVLADEAPADRLRSRPVSRTVMLSRPGGSPRPAGALPGKSFGTPW